jgi:hypothetical protein
MDNDPRIRPLTVDENGTVRFRTNHIVRYLLDLGPFDLNHLQRISAFAQEDWTEFFQLLGYSVAGFGDVSHIGS